MKSNKNIWIFVGFLVVLAAVAGVMYFAIGRNNPGVAKGGKTTISLETSGGVPYEWSCKVTDGSIAKTEGPVNRDLSNGAEGGAAEVIYTIRGVKSGETTARCEYWNIVSNEDIPEETREYSVVVDDSLNTQVKITKIINEDN